MGPGPEIAVVVPTYERADLLRRCLESLRASDLPAGTFEVCVVDDGSGPETVSVLEEVGASWPGLRWVSQPNRGPATARNRGVTMTDAPLILFVDDDIVAPAPLVSQHLEFHRSVAEGNLGLVGRVAWHPQLEVTDFMRWLDSTTLQFNFEHMDAGPVARPWEAFYTCNLSLPRKLLEDVGGFDERFPFPAFEDTDLGYRLAGRGFQLVYNPEVLAWHARAVTLEQFTRRMRMVGESGALLRQAQPDLSIDLPPPTTDRRPAWKVAASRLLPAVSAAIPSRRLRHRYYRHKVESAFGEGAAAVDARSDH